MNRIRRKRYAKKKYCLKIKKQRRAVRLAHPLLKTASSLNIAAAVGGTLAAQKRNTDLLLQNASSVLRASSATNKRAVLRFVRRAGGKKYQRIHHDLPSPVATRRTSRQITPALARTSTVRRLSSGHIANTAQKVKGL